MQDVIAQEVIITKLETRGDGKTWPIRRILQVWDKEGNLIAERDDLNYCPIDYRFAGKEVFVQDGRRLAVATTEEDARFIHTALMAYKPGNK